MSYRLQKRTMASMCARTCSLTFFLFTASILTQSVSGDDYTVDGHRFLWIDAEDFDRYGGWTLDTQYVHRMGSAYLIASGIGQPVDDALTDVNVPQAGRYHVWVRARNWLQAHAPGRFQLRINGQSLGKELGAPASDHWVWEQAGSVELSAGPVTIALHDLTGYYGRCDAIILTSDADYEPPREGWDSVSIASAPETLHPVQLQRARDELIRITFGYWDYVKNYSPERERAKNYALDLFPNLNVDGRTHVIQNLGHAHGVAAEILAGHVGSMTKNQLKAYLAYLAKDPSRLSESIKTQLHRVAAGEQYAYCYVVNEFLGDF